MRLSKRWRAGASMAALFATVLWAGMSGASAQPAGYVIVNGADKTAPDKQKTSSIHGPGAFPSIQEIPDASAVSAGSSEAVEEPAARPMTEAEKHVRVVGPKFLPGPEEAIDLRAPGRTPGR